MKNYTEEEIEHIKILEKNKGRLEGVTIAILLFAIALLYVLYNLKIK